MLTLKMLKGMRDGLKEPYSILLSELIAKQLAEEKYIGKKFGHQFQEFDLVNHFCLL
jgi:hypothetical protein